MARYYTGSIHGMEAAVAATEKAAATGKAAMIAYNLTNGKLSAEIMDTDNWETDASGKVIVVAFTRKAMTAAEIRNAVDTSKADYVGIMGELPAAEPQAPATCKTTLVSALKDLKAAGVTQLVGMTRTNELDTYLAHAEDTHANAVKYAAEGVKSWQYMLDHEADHRLIAMPDGHYIITELFDWGESALYGDYTTEDEMNAAFEAYQIAEQAEAIADEMEAKRSDELPRAAWVMIATAELKSAYAAAKAAFEREFGGI